jgi:hypothetical protein
VDAALGQAYVAQHPPARAAEVEISAQVDAEAVGSLEEQTGVAVPLAQ